MKKSTKILIVVLAVILIGVIIYFIFKPKKITNSETPYTPKPPSNGGSNTNTAANDNFPLKVGSVGENVKRLQMALNRINTLNTITVDGVFGNDTRLKLLRTLAISMYGVGPTVTENQLTNIISKSNNL